MTGLVNGSTVELGTGTNIYLAGKGTDSITLTSGAGTDTIVQNDTTAADAITITNFTVGTDTVDLSEVGSTAKGATAAWNTVKNTTIDVAATDAIVYYSVGAGAVDLVNATAASNMLVLSDALATALDVGLEAGGAYALTTAQAFAAGEGILVLWSDGTDAYLSSAETGNTRNNVAIVGADLAIVDLITFVGVTDADDITVASWGAVI